MLIDTHCHLNFKAFKKDKNAVIERALNAGVNKIIIPGAKIGSSKEAVSISAKYKCCYAAIGVHPHHASDLQEITDMKTTLLDELTKIINKSTKVAAIGEIGLDYHEYKGYPKITPETKTGQVTVFRQQLNVAALNNLPVILHCRNAHDDLIEILSSYVSEKGIKPKGVFHCFDGEKKHLKKILQMGFYVGFDGNITYPENEKMIGIIKTVPLEKLLLETDSPFLTPLPFRGTRNEPSYLKYSVKYLEKITGIPYRQISDITYNNALKLFNLKV